MGFVQGILDFTIFVVSAVGVAITAGLIYYSLRTLVLFKRNVAARAWIYICMSAIFSSLGVVAFLIESLSPMGLLPLGGICETVGASFLFLGLRKNFLFWASKDHFT